MIKLLFVSFLAFLWLFSFIEVFLYKNDDDLYFMGIFLLPVFIVVIVIFL